MNYAYFNLAVNFITNSLNEPFIFAFVYCCLLNSEVIRRTKFCVERGQRIATDINGRAKMSQVLRIILIVMHLVHVQEVNAEYDHTSNITATITSVFDDGRLSPAFTTTSGTREPISNSSYAPVTAFTSGNSAARSSMGGPSTLWQYRVGVAILAYGSPPLLVLATIGNTMSIIILQQPVFRKSSTSFILSALALVDLLYVDVGLTRQWIVNLFSRDWRLISRATCKTHVFFIYFLQMVIMISSFTWYFWHYQPQERGTEELDIIKS